MFVVNILISYIKEFYHGNMREFFGVWQYIIIYVTSSNMYGKNFPSHVELMVDPLVIMTLMCFIVFNVFCTREFITNKWSDCSDSIMENFGFLMWIGLG